MKNFQFKTSISTHKNEELYIHGVKHEELINNLDFTQAIFFLLRGRLPQKNEEKMCNAIFVAAMEHGVAPPSGYVGRAIISGGSPFQAGVAGSILSIGDIHGGAIEQCAKILQETYSSDASTPLAERARSIVQKFRMEGKKIPGFGHRIYIQDPRTKNLFEIAKKLKFYGKFVQLAQALEKKLERATGKKLCLNIDGAIAALISEMGFDWKLGKGFFIISRTPGIVAHIYEEIVKGVPLRRLDDEQILYEGAPPTSLKKSLNKKRPQNKAS